MIYKDYLSVTRYSINILKMIHSIHFANNQYLNVRRVPSISGSCTTGRLELNGGIVAHGVNVNRPVVVGRYFVVALAGVLQSHFHGRVSAAAILVLDLAEANVAPSEPIGVVEGSNAAYLGGLIGIKTPS